MNIYLIYAVVFGGLVLILLNTLVSTVKDVGKVVDNTKRKTRISQMKKLREGKRKTTKENIDQLTKPFINKYFAKLSSIFPSFSNSNIKKVSYNLGLSGWTDTFTAQSYIMFNFMLKVVGAGIILIALFTNLFTGAIMVIFSLLLMFAFDFVFQNTVKQKEEELFDGFPDFIRITNSFLVAKIPFVESMERSIDYVNDAWKPYIQRFVEEATNLNVNTALDNLKDSIDMFEVKEFVGLIKLSQEQGGEYKDSFEAQAEKVTEMKKTLLLKEIERREGNVTMLMLPLLLAIMAIMLIPMLENLDLLKEIA